MSAGTVVLIAVMTIVITVVIYVTWLTWVELRDTHERLRSLEQPPKRTDDPATFW